MAEIKENKDPDCQKARETSKVHTKKDVGKAFRFSI